MTAALSNHRGLLFLNMFSSLEETAYKPKNICHILSALIGILKHSEHIFNIPTNITLEADRIEKNLRDLKSKETEHLNQISFTAEKTALLTSIIEQYMHLQRIFHFTDVTTKTSSFLQDMSFLSIGSIHFLHNTDTVTQNIYGAMNSLEEKSTEPQDIPHIASILKTIQQQGKIDQNMPEALFQAGMSLQRDLNNVTLFVEDAVEGGVRTKTFNAVKNAMLSLRIAQYDNLQRVLSYEKH
jgi:hypothetical protein